MEIRKGLGRMEVAVAVGPDPLEKLLANVEGGGSPAREQPFVGVTADEVYTLLVELGRKGTERLDATLGMGPT